METYRPIIFSMEAVIEFTISYFFDRQQIYCLHFILRCLATGTGRPKIYFLNL